MNNPIKILREFLGFKTPKEFSAYLDLGVNTIYTVEKGLRQPGYEVLKAIKTKYPYFNVNFIFDADEPTFLPTPEGMMLDKNVKYSEKYPRKEEYLKQQLNELREKVKIYSEEAEALRHVVRLVFNKPVKLLSLYDIKDIVTIDKSQVEGGKLLWSIYMIIKKLEELQDTELNEIVQLTLKSLADNMEKLRIYLESKNSITEKINLIKNLQNQTN